MGDISCSKRSSLRNCHYYYYYIVLHYMNIPIIYFFSFLGAILFCLEYMDIRVDFSGVLCVGAHSGLYALVKRDSLWCVFGPQEADFLA